MQVHEKEVKAAAGERFQTVRIGPGISFRYLPDSKWKTLSIDVFCMAPVRRETVTKLAMVPRLARRGTSRFPTMRDLARRLELMYGASLGAEVTKVGPAQVLRFGIDLPSPAFLDPGSGGPIDGVNLGEAMSFLWDVAIKPYLERGAYPEDRFETEREEQRRDILSIINHRPRYAMVRLVEEMSRGHDSGLPSWGLLEDLPKLDPRDTWETWAETLTACPISIYAIGEGARELGEILERARLEFPLPRAAKDSDPLKPQPPPEPSVPIQAEDFLPGEQTVLCMAFHTGITETDPDLAAFIMYEGILGGFPHSKLFVNVREKNSLAYFADTSLNTWRGMVVATAGIMDENREKVADLISEQVEAMRRGDISNEEIDNTRAGLVRRYRSESDSQSALVRRFLCQEIMGGPASEDELVARIQMVTRDDIVRVAERATLKGVYALRAKDDGSAD